MTVLIVAVYDDCVVNKIDLIHTKLQGKDSNAGFVQICLCSLKLLLFNCLLLSVYCSLFQHALLILPPQ